MKKLLFAFFGLILACNATQKQAALPSEVSVQGPVAFANSITENELKEHLYIYASDSFQGRETGTQGQKKAVQYLRSQYVKMGIPAAQSNGDYFQKVPLEITHMPQGSLDVAGNTFSIKEDFVAFSPLQGTFENVVYAGYGIDDDRYSDYNNLDVSGKIVLIKEGEPRNKDGTYVITGDRRGSKWSNLSESLDKKTKVLIDKGARAIVYLDNLHYPQYQRAFEFLSASDEGSMSLKAADTLPPLIVVPDHVALKIYPGITLEDAPRMLQCDISFNIENTNENVDSENVVALIKGSKKPNEYLIISSHLDHIGISDDGKINNGADDDGSGSVALLEIAEAFELAAKAGQGPARSVVFLHVTGEEKGLLGSQYYTDVDPIFPLSATEADLNIDMIGRTDPKREGSREYVYLIGSDKLSSELHRLSEAVNQKYTQLELDYTYNDENDPNRFYYRSDHYNFAKNNIPIIFYFNGTHADYHRPTDTPDKINYDLLAKRAKLIFYTAWELANRTDRVVVDKLSK